MELTCRRCQSLSDCIDPRKSWLPPTEWFSSLVSGPGRPTFESACGRAWCTNTARHPGEGGYPDPDRHVPWHECRGPERWISEARRDLDGADVELSVSVAAAFRFGQQREFPVQAPTRVVIETWESASGETVTRLSVSPGEALRLARVLTHLVDEITFARRAA